MEFSLFVLLLFFKFITMQIIYKFFVVNMSSRCSFEEINRISKVPSNVKFKIMYS